MFMYCLPDLYADAVDDDIKYKDNISRCKINTKWNKNSKIHSTLNIYMN